MQFRNQAIYALMSGGFLSLVNQTKQLSHHSFWRTINAENAGIDPKVIDYIHQEIYEGDWYIHQQPEKSSWLALKDRIIPGITAE
jgi:hypothetical protein